MALVPAGGCATERHEVAVRELSAANATLTQRVDPASAKPDDTRFVEVQVVEVVNPSATALSFEVFFEPAGAPRVRLGTFSLFPANNPGTFIVATQGKVDRAGTLIVSMTVPKPMPHGVPLKVGISSIALSSGQPRR